MNHHEPCEPTGRTEPLGLTLGVILGLDRFAHFLIPFEEHEPDEQEADFGFPLRYRTGLGASEYR
jgi:hypothetical protein